MALSQVSDMVARARVLLQDKVEPYRYPEADLIAALNEACAEAKRIRPDLFLRTFNQFLPTYTAGTDATTAIPEEYRPTFIYYMAGNTSLQDEEETQDNRATIFLNKFVAQLMTLPS